MMWLLQGIVAAATLAQLSFWVLLALGAVMFLLAATRRYTRSAKSGTRGHIEVVDWAVDFSVFFGLAACAVALASCGKPCNAEHDAQQRGAGFG